MSRVAGLQVPRATAEYDSLLALFIVLSALPSVTAPSKDC